MHFLGAAERGGGVSRLRPVVDTPLHDTIVVYHKVSGLLVLTKR